MKEGYFNRCNAVSFITAFTVLATQILVFRIISAKLYNNYAFLVISLTMLGFALSGVILAVKYEFIKRARHSIHASTYFFIISLILSTVLFYHLPIHLHTTLDKFDYIRTLLRTISLSCLFVIPFTFGGLILGILLSNKHLQTKKIYCYDLIGSALGAILIVSFISLLGVEKSMLLLCALFLLGINFVFPLRSIKTRILMISTLLLLLFLYPNYSKVFQMRHPAGTHLANLETEHYEWDPVTRIEVSNIDLVSGRLKDLDLSMIGTNKGFHQRIEKFLTQNNNAGTWAFHYDGHLDSLKGIEETLYYGAYKVTSVTSPKVLVIGVGAGMDVLSALYANASQITGVEINGATHKILKKIYKDYFKKWVDDPKVSLVHDEGRHYLSHSQGSYDIIQLTGVDSYSGTMSSANIFSENYLYTKEAVKLYYERLNEDGIINIIRLEFPNPPREMLRMLTTVVEVLRDEGIEEPAKNIVMMSNIWLNGTSLLIKKKPFTENEIQILKDWSTHNPYFIYSTTPDLPFNKFRIYQSFLELDDPIQEQAFIDLYPLNIRPASDDQPFFFRYTKWRDLFGQQIPIFELNIVVLLALLSCISWIFIFLPLKILLKSTSPLTNHNRYVLIFSCLGLGYMFIEIGFMQKLGLFLGHPNYAVSIVLSGLLLATGIGAIYSKKTIIMLKNTRNTVSCLAIVVLMEYILILPRLNLLIGSNVFFKGIIAFILLFPIGFLLGIFLPEAIDLLKKKSPQYVPWGWGINGIFSVISPVLAIALSVTFGINFLILCSLPLYLIVGYFLHLERIS